MKPMLKFAVLAQADVQGCTVPLIMMSSKYKRRCTEGGSFSNMETDGDHAHHFEAIYPLDNWPSSDTTNNTFTTSIHA
jgi:hypothetical protein